MPITDPTDFGTQLKEWWEPDDVAVSDGSTVSTWTGNNGIAFSAGVGAEPILRDGTRHPSGHKTLQFVGTKKMTAANAALNNGTVTICVMYLPYMADPTGTAHYWILSKTNTQIGTVSLRVDGTTAAITAVLRLNGSESTARTISATGFIVEAKPIIITLDYDGTTMSLRANAAEIGSLAVSGAIDTDSPGDLVLGNHPTAVNNNGAIGSLVWCAPSLNTTQRADLEAWMMARWSIADYYDDWFTTIAATQRATIAGETISKPTIRELDASTNIMFVVEEFDKVNYLTAPKPDPHNWTVNPGSPIIDAATTSVTTCRAVSAVKDGSTWHILVDDTGDFHHFSGTNLASLTDHGQVFAGTGTGWEEFVRHPYIATTQINGKWPVFYGGRDGSPTGNIGATGVVFWDFSTFTDRQQILDVTPLWWERTDVSAPCAWFRDGRWELVYVGYNDGVDGFPHQFGLAHSDDGMAPWTRLAAEVPILVCANDGFRDEAINTPEFYDDGTDIHLYFSGGPGIGIYSLKVGQAFLDAGASQQNVSIVSATETDTAQALSVTKTIFKTLASVAEADAAQALAFTKPIHITLGAAAETDLAQELDLPDRWVPVNRRSTIAVARREGE